MQIARSRAVLLLACLAVAAPSCAGGGLPASPSFPLGAAAPVWEVPATQPPAPISSAEYAQRRSALAAGIQDGVFVAFGSVEPELDYLPYAQNASFRYLTGVTEAGAALVIVKQGETVREELFVLPRNPAREIWEGARLGAEGAQRLTGVPARTHDRLVPVLDSLLAQHRTLYTLTDAPTAAELGDTRTGEQQILAQLLARHPATRIVSIDNALRRLRAAKSPAELDLIRRAIYISALAHREAMRAVGPGMNEFEIHALVEYMFRRNGAERPAYGSIVGSGPNSTTLHYRDADRFMQADEVLLMDVGASYRGYAADVTRTIPVNGTFSAEQRAVYEIVLAAQKAAEAQARAGATWQQLNGEASRVLADGLTRLGLIDSPEATFRCQAAEGLGDCPQLRLFYMHGLGHGIGLDVHDPDPSHFGAFQIGSAFTIEPGIYVRADAFDYLPDTPENRAMIERLRPTLERYRNIGVRIEDNYIITPTGLEHVSAGVPREISEIEALMREPGMGEDTRLPDVVEWYRATEPGGAR
jgi:Xaa-Pro aminopeptidase